MEHKEIASRLTKLAKSLIADKDYWLSIVSQIEGIQKKMVNHDVYGLYDLEYSITRLSKTVKEAIEEERQKHLGGLVGEAIDAFSDEKGVMMWHGKYVNANLAIDILDNALPDGYTGAFHGPQVARFIRAYSQCQFRWAREYSPALYVKGFKDKAEADRILTSAQRLKPNELSIEAASKTIDISLTSKLHSYPFQDADILNAEIRIWWD